VSYIVTHDDPTAQAARRGQPEGRSEDQQVAQLRHVFLLLEQIEQLAYHHLVHPHPPSR